MFFVINVQTSKGNRTHSYNFSFMLQVVYELNPTEDLTGTNNFMVLNLWFFFFFFFRQEEAFFNRKKIRRKETISTK